MGVRIPPPTPTTPRGSGLAYQGDTTMTITITWNGDDTGRNIRDYGIGSDILDDAESSETRDAADAIIRDAYMGPPGRERPGFSHEVDNQRA